MKGWNDPIANYVQITTPYDIILNRPILLESWDSYSSEHLTAPPDILFWSEKYVCKFYIYHILHNFSKRIA